MLRLLHTLFGAKSAGGSGEQGERLAAEWLKRERRFKVVSRNWRNPQDRREEIDLVCRDGEVLVFVEVKARAAGALVPGYHAVDERKKRVLRRAIETYLAKLEEKPVTFRLDVVEVALPVARDADAMKRSKNPSAVEAVEILHFENVPLFSKHFRP